ncbi:uncharacterized protein LOC124158067 [Ischnura elegans]|uniref:uncharacterized protein LOC124158067 n=1 Tax=Ischnura elegans TaxID=197161 RepID=UPI001ED8B348|nr:uncharacterized protein LOC124158067 [Ischnura elegans]
MAEISLNWNGRRPCVLTAVLALHLFIAILPAPTSSCPTSCVCKWKGGKQTVECLNKGLAVLPDGMDAGTQVLEFSGNNLQVLGRDRFLRAGLLHLQRIYVSRCRLGSIDDHAFRGLANLVELDLSDNLLSRLPSPTTFADFPSLMRLSLSNNPIRRIPSRAFYPLTSLVTLEMSGCEVENIEEMAFSGLDSLEWLKLDGNRLRTIGGGSGAGASAILPASLHGVDLHHNPWHCDCRLLGLRSWLLRYNIPHSIEPRCNTPARLATKPVKSLPPHDLACLPDVSPTAMFLEIAEGRNASLLCRVSAIPDATVSWWFRGRILQNATLVAPGLHLYYFLEEVLVPGGSAPPSSAGQEKRSELFIINANAAEGNGTYACVAENAAGAAQSNYTVRIVVREERGEGVEIEAASTAILPPEYAVVVISAGVAALVLLVALSATVAALALRCRRKRRRRRKKERSKAAAAFTDHGKVSSVEGGSVAGCGRPLDPGAGNGGPGRDAVGGGGVASKANGTVVTPQNRLHHEMTMMGASASVVLANTGMGHRQRHGGALLSSAGPPGERNPDLINDTTGSGGGDSGAEGCKERLREAGDGEEKVEEEGARESVNSGPNSYQEAMENAVEEFSEDGKVRSIATSPVGGLRLLRDPPPQSCPQPQKSYGRGPAYRYVHPGHFHTADVHLSPGRFLDSDGYPVDYGLPKLPHPPVPLSLPLVPMPPLSAPPQGDHSAFYRTLPHRRANPPASAAPRYSRDAEYYPVALVGGSSSYEPPGAVRYQREGYPYSSPPTTAAPAPPSYPPTPGEEGVAFSPGDPAFLPSPPAAYKGGDSPGEEVAACCGAEEGARGPPHSPLAHTSGPHPPALQESPDEGYEDDGTEI